MNKRLRRLAAKFASRFPSGGYFWIPVLVAAGLYVFVALFFRRSMADLLHSLLAEAIAGLVAFAVVWEIVERRARERDRRVAAGLHRTLQSLRNACARGIAVVTSGLVGVPPFNKLVVDERWVKENYDWIRETLGIIPASDAPGAHSLAGIDWDAFREEGRIDRSTSKWSLAQRAFHPLLGSISSIRAKYASALEEYPELLDVLERLSADIRLETEQWDRFERLEHDRTLASYQLARTDPETAKMLRRDETVTPYAVQNVVYMAALSFGVVVAITLILRDWDPLPPADHQKVFTGPMGNWPDSAPFR